MYIIYLFVLVVAFPYPFYAAGWLFGSPFLVQTWIGSGALFGSRALHRLDCSGADFLEVCYITTFFCGDAVKLMCDAPAK